MDDEMEMTMLLNEEPVAESRFDGMTADEVADYLEREDIRRAEATAARAYCGNLFAESWCIF